jgi:hypothetical protein
VIDLGMERRAQHNTNFTQTKRMENDAVRNNVSQQQVATARKDGKCM